MQVIMSILSVLALFVWAETASAQSATYSASVSFHSGLEQVLNLPPLSDKEVTKILTDASRMLQKPDHKSADDKADDNDVACDVTLTLKGPVRTFDPPGKRLIDLAAVVDEDNIEAVHGVRSADGADFHIKVVQDIRFCRKELNHFKRFAGCAFSPPHFNSMIVIHPALYKGPHDSKGPDHLLWAHEFGHLTGLRHRDDEPVSGLRNRDDEPASLTLMTSCDVAGQFFNTPDSSVRINKAECRRLLGGPGFKSPDLIKSDAKAKCKCPDKATCGL